MSYWHCCLTATPKSTPSQSRALHWLLGPFRHGRNSDPNTQAKFEQERVGVGAAVHKTRIHFSGASSGFLFLSLSLFLLLTFCSPFVFVARSSYPSAYYTHAFIRIATSFHSFGFSDLIYFICFVWHPQVLPQWYINFVGVSSSQKRRHAAPLILNEQERAANFRRYIYIPTSRTMGSGVVNQMCSITLIIAHTTAGNLFLWPTQVAIINVD